VRRLTDSGAKLIVTTVAGGCAAVVLALPQPIDPTETPSVQLDPAAVAEVRRADREVASPMPSGKKVEQLRELFAEQGRAEYQRGEPVGTAERRLSRLRRTLRRVQAKHGDRAVRSLRAHAVHGLRDALEGRMPSAKRQGVLGSFPRMLDRYGMRDSSGRLAVPFFVVRTLYKASWNAIGGLELTAGFEPVEKRAYWGGLALHARKAPVRRRLRALKRYEGLGGARVAEARGVLLFKAERYGGAREWLQRAHDAAPNFRVRNHMLAASTAQ
jgi:hypothetical protein